MDKIALLRESFSDLTYDEIAKMAELTQVCTYPANTVLCHEGAEEDAFYIIAHGEAQITKRISEQGDERVLRVVGRGDFVGEMALIQNAPRAATVRTLTECTVLEMGKADFDATLDRSPRMAVSIIRTTLDRLRANDRMAIEELQRTNALLERLDRNKLEFIQVAAHELRTPLTVMMGYVNLLHSEPTIHGDPALREMFAGLVKGTDRMHQIVNMMLDVSQIDTATLRVSPVPVPLKQLVDGLVQEIQAKAASRSQTFTVEFDTHTPVLRGDLELIRKAIYHLLSNAVKFTPDGGTITIRAEPIGMADGEPGVDILVEDTGIGIDPKDQGLIFEKFYQVGPVELHSSGAFTFKGGGPGLGLSLVHGVAQAHGGAVWVESAGYDETRLPGSIFHLVLPLHPKSTTADEPRETTAHGRARV